MHASRDRRGRQQVAGPSPPPPPSLLPPPEDLYFLLLFFLFSRPSSFRRPAQRRSTDRRPNESPVVLTGSDNLAGKPVQKLAAEHRHDVRVLEPTTAPFNQVSDAVTGHSTERALCAAVLCRADLIPAIEQAGDCMQRLETVG